MIAPKRYDQSEDRHICETPDGGYVLFSDYERDTKALSSIKTHLANLGGWREAVAELEDHCSEPVRLKNMTAALDQIDELSALLRAETTEVNNA